MAPTETAQFKHDCGMCKFLGRHTYKDQPCDLYYCPKVYGSVVIRWADTLGVSTRDIYTMISARYHYMHTKDRSFPAIVAFQRAINAGHVNYYMSSTKGGI